MTNLQEVPTEELLSFQDFPSVHTASGDNRTIPISEAQISITDDVEGNIHSRSSQGPGDVSNNPADPQPEKAFWSLEYYQKFFDVDTSDVIERIMASITPKWDNSLKHHLRSKPDLYGPFWISVTLIFTIAIGGNIANYLQHANSPYHWRYDFHLVSYSATAIFLYVTLVPFLLWALLKWSVHVQDVEGLDELSPGILELICVYGYSLFIYIPVSILWSIQINILQWALLAFGTFISGSVLLLTLMPALRFSEKKYLLIILIISFHLVLSAGFMLYFFHGPSDTTPVSSPVALPTKNITISA
ncbi:protein YIPF1 [Diorhabda sublineata]|uniref:protein YIPF1 n=1 Tax=Diorhabda sublineata TaxID=1163346 RepID=UPI0024E16B16|nr:protein YIPF1 [Diorhabda sublineata]